MNYMAKIKKIKIRSRLLRQIAVAKKYAKLKIFPYEQKHQKKITTTEII